MIEIICNKDESDKNSHHVKEGVTSRRLCVYIHQFYCI